MRFAGIQPLSLIDYPGRACAILFTQGCVFRCAYCHNPDLIPTGQGTHVEEDILERLRLHKVTADAVCITGGEPTLQPDLIPFLRTLKDEGYAVKLDTNGVHPRIIDAIVHEQLVDYFAMDLKHTWEKYHDVIRVRVPTLVENCRVSFDLIQHSGIAHEFRTTILPGTHVVDDFATMASYLHSGETYIIQSFRAGKTLEANIAPAEFDAARVVETLRPRFPQLILSAR